MLSLYPAFPEDFTTDTPLRVTIDALEVPLWCERFERRGQSGATATFADFDTERRAQELVGLEFRIEMNGEEDDDDNPLFELEIGGRQVLVPAVEEFIARIDFEGRTMHLVLPEGLLTLE